MIPENDWKFFEATEQRIKHLHRHRQENLVALLRGENPRNDPDALARKEAALVQEMDYPARVESARAADPTPDQARHLDLHRRWVLTTLFETHPDIHPLLQDLRERFAAFRPRVGDREATWGEVRRILREEADRDLREAAWLAAVPFGTAVHDDLLDLVRRRESLARTVLDAGYPHVAYHGLDQERTEVISLLDEFERTTRDAFQRARREIAEAIGVHSVEPWDFAYGVRALQGIEDGAFPGEAAADAVHVQARRWGFEPTELPFRTHRAAAPVSATSVAVEIPADIRLIVPEQTGFEAYSAAFAAFGHALSHGHVPLRRHFLEQVPVVLREASGRLFAAVTRVPAWVEEQTGATAPQIERFLHARRIAELIDLRLRHAHNSFENIVYAHSDQEPTRLFNDVLEQTMGCSPRPVPLWAAESYHCFEPFHQGSRVLGAYAAAQIAAYLGSQHAQWWNDEPVGAWWRETLASRGGAETWTETVSRATGKSLDPDALHASLGCEAFRGPALEEEQELDDDAVAEYFKDIDLSDLE